MTYHSNRGWLNLVFVFGVGLLLILAVFSLAGKGAGILTSIFGNRQAERIENLRLLDVELQYQQAREALAQAELAGTRLEIAREQTAQAQAAVEYERAVGDREEAEANAYVTELLGRAAYHAIQRQGRLLYLSHVQSGVAGVLFGIVVVAGVALIVATRKKQQPLAKPRLMTFRDPLRTTCDGCELTQKKR